MRVECSGGRCGRESRADPPQKSRRVSGSHQGIRPLVLQRSSSYYHVIRVFHVIQYHSSYSTLFNPPCSTLIPPIVQIVWIATFFFPVSITATKISILCFYRSIFAIRPFRIATHCITVLCVLWCIFGLFFIAFQCKPIKAAYDLRLAPTAQCFPYGSFVLGLELSNVILDVAILALPVFVVSTLHLGTRRKMLLASIFLLGGL